MVTLLTLAGQNCQISLQGSVAVPIIVELQIYLIKANYIVSLL
jgi:hypothetical protein